MGSATRSGHRHNPSHRWQNPLFPGCATADNLGIKEFALLNVHRSCYNRAHKGLKYSLTRIEEYSYLMGGATRSSFGARSAPPLRYRVALRYRVSCQVFACAHIWQETLSLRAPRPLRYVCLALPLAPTGSTCACAPPSLCRSCRRCRSISSPLRALSVSATASFICSKGSTIGGATLPPSRPTSASCPFQGLVAWLRANRGATPRLPFRAPPARSALRWRAPPAERGERLGAPYGRPPFLSASALSCGFVSRGFPAGAVAQRLPPCRRPRLPAT